jgi:hypothetical protein
LGQGGGVFQKLVGFYQERLKLLFFTGLDYCGSADLVKSNPALKAMIGDVPFLNGGLFDEEEHDTRAGVTVPDEAVSAILHDLFERYNCTVMESTPLDREVAVDPEMLGNVFEELVTGRHESGSYYTPRPLVSFMCREALKSYLEGTTRFVFRSRQILAWDYGSSLEEQESQRACQQSQ